MEIHKSRMKQTILALLALVPALCVAAPSPHGCHYGYKTIYKTIYGVDCRTYYDTNCHIKEPNT